MSRIAEGGDVLTDFAQSIARYKEVLVPENEWRLVLWWKPYASVSHPSIVLAWLTS
ncbi:MAG: hypothetical protein ACR2QW_12590 [bacterium]